MTTLTRAQAHAALTAGGWNSSMLDTMTAIGAGESSLRLEAVGPRNSDGTEDYGWLQINSQYVTGAPFWNKSRLLSDAAYNAACGHEIWVEQGLRAWVVFANGSYLKFMPPPIGVAIARGSPAWFLVADLQTGLNIAGATPALKVDGSFGPLTEAALVAYQLAHPVEPKVAGPHYWAALT